MRSNVFIVLSLVASAVSSPFQLGDDTSVCRQIDLSKYFAKAGVKITQAVPYYNVTTYEYPHGNTTTHGNDTEPIVVTTPVYFTATGGITIIDACTFQLDNFTLTSVAPDTVWYGKMASDYSVGQQISYDAVVPLNDTTVQYKFIDGITFTTIDTLILYSRAQGLQLAYATFPKALNNGDASSTDGKTNGSGSGLTGGRSNGTSTSTNGSLGSMKFSPSLILSTLLVSVGLFMV